MPDSVEKGDISAWIDLVHLLQFHPKETESRDLNTSDLTSFPGFHCLDGNLIARLSEPAHRYVKEGDSCVDGAETWWNTPNTFAWAAIAGVVALNLLRTSRNIKLFEFSSSDWEKWAPSVVALPSISESVKGQSSLLQNCLERSREATLIRMQERIEILLRAKDGIVNFVELFQGVWSPDLAEMMISVMRDRRLSSQSLQDAVGILLRMGHIAGSELVGEAAQLTSVDKSDILWAASILSAALVDDAVKHWPTIREVMQSRKEIAREMFLMYCERADYMNTDVTACWGVSVWVAVSIFLESEFPSSDDFGEGFVTNVHRLQRFRAGIPGRLAAMGTVEGVAGLEQLVVVLPGRADVIRWALIDARARVRQNTWTPPTPSAVLELAARSSARLVRSDLELQRAVFTALCDLQTSLQGVTPVARALWNESSDGWTPKDENFLSDYITRHLRGSLGVEGVIANREVEIRAARSATNGQRTDILGQAVARVTGRVDPDELATVIVEVKGCWHPELSVAMKTQLRDRYLADANLRCGIYLIGWYLCDRWHRPKIAGRTPRHGFDLEAARKDFDDQAAQLSDVQYQLRSLVLDLAIH